MTRVALVVDVGRGQEALVFRSQTDAENFLALHPSVDEGAQGVVPIGDRRRIIRDADTLY